jgi:hypothetical protein
MRDVTKVMPPIFLRKCDCDNNEIFMGDSYIFCNYKANFPLSLHHFQYTLPNVEYDAVYQCCKIPCLDFGAHHENSLPSTKWRPRSAFFTGPNGW